MLLAAAAEVADVTAIHAESHRAARGQQQPAVAVLQGELTGRIAAGILIEPQIKRLVRRAAARDDLAGVAGVEQAHARAGLGAIGSAREVAALA